MESRDLARRRAILDAALSCFLQYGFAKTSLDDIAKRDKGENTERIADLRGHCHRTHLAMVCVQTASHV